MMSMTIRLQRIKYLQDQKMALEKMSFYRSTYVNAYDTSNIHLRCNARVANYTK